MKRYKQWGLLIGGLLGFFILINAGAFFHAAKFTHYDARYTGGKKDPLATTTAKWRAIFFGVNNPRPQNTRVPDTVYQTIWLKSNKEIACWLIPAKKSKGTVAIFHGYGGEKSSMLHNAEVFRQLGYSTLLVDFMGSGASEGNQTTLGFKEAEEVKTCVDFLSASGEKRIILMGTSMGAVAILKACQDFNLPVNAIIIECPFATMLQAVKNRFAIMGLPAFPMAYLFLFWGGWQNDFNAYQHNPAEYAFSVKCPTLLLYGAQDNKVTSEEMSQIFKNLKGPKQLIVFPEAGHENYLLQYQNEWTQAVASFLNRYQKQGICLEE